MSARNRVSGTLIDFLSFGGTQFVCIKNARIKSVHLQSFISKHFNHVYIPNKKPEKVSPRGYK